MPAPSPVPTSTSPTTAPAAPSDATVAAAPPASPPGKPPAPVVAALAPEEKKPDKNWKAILSKEAALLRDRQELAAEKQRFADQAKEVERYKQTIAEVKLNPTKLLEIGGVTYEQLTHAVLNGGTPPPDLQVKVLEDRLSAFERKQLEEREAALSRQQEEANAAKDAEITTWRRETAEAVTAQADKYPVLSAFKRASAVPGYIEGHFEKTGKILTAEEAATLMEKEITETLPSDLEAVLAVPAVREIVQKVLAKVTAPSKPANDKAAKPPASRGRTLNNGMTATTTSVPPKAETPRDLWAQMKSKLSSTGVS